MATELQVHIRPNPYEGREAMFRWNGKLYRYSFDGNDELAYKLVRDKVHPAIRDEVMLSVENDEWNRTPVYPLGVVYVGEAVSDCCCGPGEVTVTFDDEPTDCDNSLSRQMSDIRSVVRSQWWCVAVAMVVIGLVACICASVR